MKFTGFFKRIAAAILIGVEILFNSVSDFYYLMKGFFRFWWRDIRQIIKGWSISETFEVLKLLIGSIPFSFHRSLMKLRDRVRQRDVLREHRARNGIVLGPFSWANFILKGEKSNDKTYRQSTASV